VIGDSGSISAHARPPEPAYVLPVDDPRRQALRRAVFGTLLASAIFFVFTYPKQIKPLYAHAPWENDPFDTVYSFTMFIVPLVAAYFLVQVSLCRRSEPLPVSRVLAILRACRVAVGAIAIALLTDWVAVAVGANRSQWTSGATGILIALLILTTVVTGKVVTSLLRVPKLGVPWLAENVPASDWLADMVTVAERESHWLGPLRRPALRVLAWIDRMLLARVRRHPLLTAGLAAGAFGITVGGNQAILEGYILSATLLTIGLLSCGMFAFLVVAGSYLGVARSSTPLYGARRRAVDSGVAGCIAAVAALAFRDSLWWAVGSSQSAAGPGQFAALIGSAILVAFAVAFAVESLLRSHSRAARP
jgi:hypothetical protein